MLYKYIYIYIYVYILYAEWRGVKTWTVNFSMISFSTGCTVVLEHYCSCDGLLQGTCLEGNLYR